MQNSNVISIWMIVTLILNITIIALLAFLLVFAGKALKKYLQDDKKK